jgi:hypothetical protein
MSAEQADPLRAMFDVGYFPPNTPLFYYNPTSKLDHLS